MREPINKRIEELVETRYNGNKSAFASDIGVSEANVRNYMKETMPKLNVVTKIIEVCNVDYKWLVLGESETVSTFMEPEPQYLRIKKGDAKKEVQKVPLYDIEASAGVVSLFTDTTATEPVDYISIPNLPKCDGAIHVTGDSMYPVLKSGDIVMYKSVAHQERFFVWGEMYIVSFQLNGDDYISVKWVQKSDLGSDYIKLVSANQHHQDLDVPINAINALALIKASVRINSMK